MFVGPSPVKSPSTVAERDVLVVAEVVAVVVAQAAEGNMHSESWTYVIVEGRSNLCTVIELNGIGILSGATNSG